MTSRDPDERKPRPDDEEVILVPEDDRVIGRAFRLSMVVLVVAVVVVVLVVAVLRRGDDGPAAGTQDAVAPRAIEAVADPPALPFVDITSRSGIDFVHENGAAGDKLLPETMGGGAAFLDHDGDGDIDLVLVNSAPWSATRFSATGAPRTAGAPTSALYRNDGTGRFENVTADAGLDVVLYGMGAAVGDIDADGDPDLFLTAVGSNRLFVNEGGRFRDATVSAGVAGDDDAWSTSAAFFDLENDGDLDLFVCNYVRWSPDIDREIDFRMTGVGRAYGPPTQFAGTFPYLYRNDGDGTFTDISEESGIQVVNPATGEPVAKSLAVVPVDLGGDGRVDLIVANDTVRNFLFRSLGDGAFEEIGGLAGVGYDSAGAATGAMGTDIADYRNDGRLGVAIGNFANEMSSLYVQQANAWEFADEAIVEGVGAPSRAALSFGLFFFDADLDGRLDLVQANGHIEDDIARVQSSQRHAQPAQLFWNAGRDARRSFVEMPADALGDLARPIVGRGAAFADIDADGDLDVLLTQVGGPPLLLRNEQALGHHWTRVRLIGNGVAVNRDAVGAWIELTTVDGVVLRRAVMPSRSYLSSVEPTVTFGLGDQTSIGSLRVRWPDGTVDDVTDRFALDATILIER